MVFNVVWCRLDNDYSDLVKKHSFLKAESLHLEKQVAEMKNEKNNFLQTEQLLKQVPKVFFLAII